MSQIPVESWGKVVDENDSTQPGCWALEIEAMRVGVGATASEAAADLASSAILAYLRAQCVNTNYARAIVQPPGTPFITVPAWAWERVRTTLYGQ